MFRSRLDVEPSDTACRGCGKVLALRRAVPGLPYIVILWVSGCSSSSMVSIKTKWLTTIPLPA